MRQNLSSKILIGLVIGALLGIAARLAAQGAPWLDWLVENITLPVGQIFLRLLFMLVIPLLFSALVLGISDLDVRRLGRMGGRMLGYTVVVSSIAVLIGMTLVNWLQPGVGLPESLRGFASASAAATPIPKPPETSGAALIVGMFPDNPVKAAANGEMLGVIIFR